MDRLSRLILALTAVIGLSEPPLERGLGTVLKAGSVGTGSTSLPASPAAPARSPLLPTPRASDTRTPGRCGGFGHGPELCEPQGASTTPECTLSVCMHPPPPFSCSNWYTPSPA